MSATLESGRVSSVHLVVHGHLSCVSTHNKQPSLIKSVCVQHSTASLGGKNPSKWNIAVIIPVYIYMQHDDVAVFSRRELLNNLKEENKVVQTHPAWDTNWLQDKMSMCTVLFSTFIYLNTCLLNNVIYEGFCSCDSVSGCWWFLKCFSYDWVLKLVGNHDKGKNAVIFFWGKFW